MKVQATAVVPSNFAFEPTVLSHGWYRLAPFLWNDTEKSLQRTEWLPGKEAVDLRITAQKGALFIQSSQSLAGADRALQQRLTRMFQLNLDTTEFHKLCRASSTHRGIARRRFGRLLCGSTLFEDVVKIIATTNTTWAQTVRMVQLLVERCGPRSRSGKAAFPRPEDVARVSAEDLKRDCRLGYRSGFIHTIARGVVDGRIDLDALARGSDPEVSPEERLEQWRSLPGIGPYGAAHLMAMEGRHDYIAVDTEFRRFVRDRYHGSRSVKDATMVRRYARWGRWRYLAYWSEIWESYLQQMVRER